MSLTQTTDKSVLLKNQNILERRVNHLHNLYCLLKSLVEDSNGETPTDETDPIFSASPSFGITSPDITNWNEATSLMHEHFNSAVLQGITSTKVTQWDSAFSQAHTHSNLSDLNGITGTLIGNWNTAFGWGNHASLYLPIAGGTLTGTGGSGFLGIPSQTSAPATPASGLRLYADSTAKLAWKDTSGFVRSFVGTITADRSYTLPDSSGEIMVSGPTQTMAGAKTFSSTITSASILPNANGSRTLGNGSFQYQTTYTQNVLGTSLFLSTIGVTDMGFGINSAATRIGTWYSDGNLLVQTGGTHTNGGFKFDVNGTSRLNGNVTLGGNMVPDGDNTRSFGSSTMRWGALYTINVAKGNAGNSMNLVVTGSGDIFFRVQQTTNNIHIQAQGAAPADTGYKLTVDGTGATSGAFSVLGGLSQFAGMVQPTANATYDLGTSTLRWRDLFVNNIKGAGTLRLTSATTNSIVFSQNADSNTIGIFFSTTGNLSLQAPAAIPTDDTAYRLQIGGKVKITDAPTYADNAAAITGGLVVGAVYKQSDGNLRIVI